LQPGLHRHLADYRGDLLDNRIKALQELGDHVADRAVGTAARHSPVMYRGMTLAASRAPRTKILSGSIPNLPVIVAAVTVSLLSEKEAYWLTRTAKKYAL
jgi:hypothetical protein